MAGSFHGTCDSSSGMAGFATRQSEGKDMDMPWKGPDVLRYVAQEVMVSESYANQH